MDHLSVCGLLLLSVAQALGQLSTPVPDVGEVTGPTGPATDDAGSPFAFFSQNRDSAGNSGQGWDNNPFSPMGRGLSRMGMSDGRNNAAELANYNMQAIRLRNSQVGQPALMMTDPRMSDPRMGAMSNGGSMYPAQVSGYPAGMPMSGPRMGALMGGGGGGGRMQGFGGFNPAMFRGQLGSAGGYPLTMQRGGIPMQFQSGGPMGQDSPFGLNPYSGEMNGQMGMGGGSPFPGMMMNGMYPGGGPGETQIITAGNGGPGGFAMPGGAAGPGSVSFIPVARVKPGPGLVIVGNSNPNPFDLSPASSNDTDDSFDSSLADLMAPQNTTDATVSTTRRVGTTRSNVVVAAASNSTTTPTPCPHPVYMNRVFMSTALQMGLISANTSCVVLVDH